MRKIEHPGNLMMKNRLEIAILLWKTMKMMTSQRQYVINKILGETEKFNENYRRLSDWLNRKEAEIALIHEHNCDVIMSKMRDVSSFLMIDLLYRLFDDVIGFRDWK